MANLYLSANATWDTAIWRDVVTLNVVTRQPGDLLIMDNKSLTFSAGMSMTGEDATGMPYTITNRNLHGRTNGGYLTIQYANNETKRINANIWPSTSGSSTFTTLGAGLTSGRKLIVGGGSQDIVVYNGSNITYAPIRITSSTILEGELEIHGSIMLDPNAPSFPTFVITSGSHSGTFWARRLVGPHLASSLSSSYGVFQIEGSSTVPPRLEFDEIISSGNTFHHTVMTSNLTTPATIYVKNVLDMTLNYGRLLQFRPYTTAQVLFLTEASNVSVFSTGSVNVGDTYTDVPQSKVEFGYPYKYGSASFNRTGQLIVNQQSGGTCVVDSNIRLDQLTVDWEAFVNQLQQKLSQHNAWNAVLVADTGRMLLESIAAIGTFDQYAIHRAREETSLITAQQESSVFAIMRTLGVRINRKKPANVTVTFTRETTAGDLIIPSYSTFYSSEATFFNVDPIVFADGIAQAQATIYEGILETKLFESNGADYQYVTIDIPNFVVSDSDIRMLVNGQTVDVVHDGMWNYPHIDRSPQKVCQDITLTSGQARFMFGNNLYGYKPSSGSTIEIRFVRTNGKNAQSTNYLGREVNSNDFDISGITTSNIVGGDNQSSWQAAKKISPYIHGSRDRLFTETDYYAGLISYPNMAIADAFVVSQRDYAPNNKNYAMVGRVSVLKTDGTPMTNNEWYSFENWLRKRGVAHYNYERHDPYPINVIVDADVGVLNGYVLTDIESAIVDKLTKFFEPKNGSIGASIFKSDIYNEIKSIDGVDYVILRHPSTDTNAANFLPSVSVTDYDSNGALISGQNYSYSVTTITSVGESIGGVASIVKNGNGSVRLEWDAVPSGISYNVYGRQAGQRKFIANTTDTYYIDSTLFVDSNINEPDVNNSGAFYHKLASINLVMKYTGRL
jgi:hypothetical protein